MLPPKKLAIFYGWPSTVNGTGSVAGATAVFQDYDVVIFGAGLEDPSHPDYANTVQIIANLAPNTKVYGYINSEDSNTINWGNIDKWNAIGVAGIFCDNFGYDFNVDRDRQNVLVEYTHYKGLSAFVNAWNPDDVFSDAVDPVKNPLGKAHMMGANDYYLSESFQIIVNAYQDPVFWKAKSDKMAAYKATFGTKMATVTTTDASPYEQAKWDYSYLSAALYDFDLSGWGEEFFSAASSQLPFRPRANINGTSFITAITENPSDVFSRGTNVGIKVDTVNFTVSTIL